MGGREEADMLCERWEQVYAPFHQQPKKNDKTPGETDGAADAPVRDVTSHQPSDAADMTELRWSSEGLQPAGRPEASLPSCDCISVV